MKEEVQNHKLERLHGSEGEIQVTIETCTVQEEIEEEEEKKVPLDDG
mgnify:CR=1 FL=1